ncbi:AbrB/MazE/SpoVT family DNA-binding domain-containing protein [Tepidanaerobacter sp. EBM-38]|uniref:AbrB/MazE/SpoVT family DNA-binding domain-containing protein n=1 Tax=Tepidanaerobacter TaxID=499228 RepID=UPI0034564243
MQMKSTGIVRKVDSLGRVVIPIELRRTLGISVKDALEIYVDTDRIILKKYLPACIFCGSAEDLINFDGKNICKKCAKKIENTLAISSAGDEDTPTKTDTGS